MNNNLPRLSLIESLEARQHLHGAFPVTIDFGPSDRPYAGGTIGDGGAILADRGNGYEYGWSTDVSAGAVDRDSSYTSYQRYDTNIPMPAGATWDLHVHSGKYRVKVGGGDSAIWGSTLNITAEGRTAVSGTTTSSKRLIENTIIVDVTDGKLTLGSGANAVGNRITFVTIELVGPATTPPPTEEPPPNPNPNPNPSPNPSPTPVVYPATIDFGPLNKPFAGGTIGDGGLVYGLRPNGYTFGWNADSTAQAVDRDSSYTPYQRLDSNIQILPGRVWEMALPSGQYRVKVGGGDSAVWGSTLSISAEGKTAVTGVTTSTKRFIEGTVTVDVVDGKLTIAGGSGAVDNRITYLTVERIGPATTPTDPPPPTGSINSVSWTNAANAPVAKAEGFGGTVGGKLYVFGGYVDFTYKPSTTAHVFNPATNSWSPIKALPVAMTHVATATDETGIYFVGGYPAMPPNGGQAFATTAVTKYDVATNTYVTLPALPQSRGGGAAALLGRTLYFMGGNDSSRADRREVWALNLDNLAAGWSQKASLPAARNHPSAVAINGSVYFLAGQTGQDGGLTTKNDLYKYNPATDTWASDVSLPGARSHVTSSTFVVSGKILVLGGESSHGSTIRNADLFDPATGVWKSLGQLPAARFSGVAGLLDDGRIVYSTGYSTNFQGTTWIGTIG